jgi:ABC-type branched-subunit amino acid transport system substrate-binding protein
LADNPTVSPLRANVTMGINPLFDIRILPSFTTLGINVNNTQGVTANAVTLITYQLQLEQLIGIIGPDLSSEAIAIAPIAGTFETPLLSFSATSPVLSSRTLYPTFLRDVPASDVTAEAMIDLCYTLGMIQVCENILIN